MTNTRTVLVLRMARRIWKTTKQEPGTAGPGNMLGCCLVALHFPWAILSTSTEHSKVSMLQDTDLATEGKYASDCNYQARIHKQAIYKTSISIVKPLEGWGHIAKGKRNSPSPLKTEFRVYKAM